MTDFAENLTQFQVGTQTVVFYAKDSSSPVSVAFAVVGSLSFKQSQMYATLIQNNKSVVIKLDQAQLGASVPVRGSKIVLADETPWRVLAIDYTHVSKFHNCICVDIK